MKDVDGLNIVGKLRQRTVEEDINDYLKSVLGGYSKKSVIEYVNHLRSQQIEYAETFNRHVQSILEEKEELKKENKRLLIKLSGKEADLSAVTEAVRTNGIESREDYSDDDITVLKNHILSLEIENKELSDAKNVLEKELEAAKSSLQSAETTVKQHSQELRTRDDLIALDKVDIKKLRSTVSENAAFIEEQESKINQLSEMVSNGDAARLGIMVSELEENVDLKEKIIDRYQEELAAGEEKIKGLYAQNNKLQQSVSMMKSAIDMLSVQNEELVFTNKELSETVETNNKRMITLIKEKSEEKVAKIVAQRKLENMNLQETLREVIGDQSEDIVKTSDEKETAFEADGSAEEA